MPWTDFSFRAKLLKFSFICSPTFVGCVPLNRLSNEMFANIGKLFSANLQKFFRIKVSIRFDDKK